MTEQELIESLAESFCVATEFLDSQTIIKCLRAALRQDVEHYQEVLQKYTDVYNAVSES
jgi:hypothetical protein